VTLLVSPEQSALLTLGQTKGTLFLSLRHPNDEILADTRPYTFREIQSLKSEGQSFSNRIGSIFRALVSSKKTDDSEQAVQDVETVEKTTQQEPKVTKKTSLHNNHIRIVRGQSEDLVIIRNLEQ
jgi:predicted CopG family antitoxin